MRTQKTLLNAKINFIFAIGSLIITFYSRKIFILYLGSNLVGLISTVGNILGFLNLAELGISTAVSFVLFKYLADSNRGKIEGVISVLGYYYRRVGFAILGGAFVLCLFFPIIFKSSKVSLLFVYVTFFTFLFQILIGFFYNYKQILLTADQKSYVVVATGNVIQICKTLLQILILLHSNGNFYLFLFIEVVYFFIASIILNKRIKKVYPWLNSSSTNGKLIKDQYLDILHKTKQLFSHSFAGFILNQTDQLLIFFFTSLNVVTIFSNYTLILQKSVFLIDQLLNSTSAGVGNLVATNDNHKIIKVFSELTVLRYWLAGITIFLLYQLTPPFIELWLGPKFLLDPLPFNLMLINIYIAITRQTNQSFLIGYGLFKDVWAPWCEAIINIFFSIFLAFYYGVTGVVLGSTISLLIIVVIWKPYFLFKEGFKNGLSNYWKSLFSYIVQFFIIFFLLNQFESKLQSQQVEYNLLSRVFKVFLQTCCFGFSYTISLYISSIAMRNLCTRVLNVLFKKSFI